MKVWETPGWLPNFKAFFFPPGSPGPCCAVVDWGKADTKSRAGDSTGRGETVIGWAPKSIISVEFA